MRLDIPSGGGGGDGVKIQAKVQSRLSDKMGGTHVVSGT